MGGSIVMTARGLVRKNKHRDRRAQPIDDTVSEHGYTERNRNLRSLGFKSYWHYLQSDMWKLIRDLVFEQKGQECVRCGGPATQVHHSAYDLKTLVGSSLTRLHPVCGDCHQSAEVVSGEKQHCRDANETLGVRGLSPRRERKDRIRLDDPSAAIHRARKKQAMRRTRERKASESLLSVPVSVQDAIRSRFGVGRHGESMRSLAREYGLPKNVVRLILGMKIR